MAEFVPLAYESLVLNRHHCNTGHPRHKISLCWEGLTAEGEVKHVFHILKVESAHSKL